MWNVGRNKNMLKLIFTLLVIGLVSSCANSTVSKIQVPQTKEGCLAIGGSWINVGLPGTPKRCDIKTGDGGKTCIDSSQCQGECLANKSKNTGSKTPGKCSDYIATFGCYRKVEKGIVGVELCAD